MKQTTKHNLLRAVRRVAALFLATLTVWVLILTANVESATAVLRDLGARPAFVTTLLQTELGETGMPGAGPWDELGRWQRLALSQSPTLHWGKDAVSALREGKSGLLPETPTPVEPDDLEESYDLPDPVTAPEGIVERTLGPSSSVRYDQGDGVYVYNRTSQAVDIPAMAQAEVSISLGEGDGPSILIMHTHGSEAYAMEGTDIYTETDTARTTDNKYNVVRVGDEMARVFTDLGLSVIHDTNLYDYPVYSGSYDRSKAAVTEYLAQYPSIKIVLDIHRDALVADDGTIYKAVTTIDGEKAAQVLLVVGTDDSGLSHPSWRENLTLAVQIQKAMNALWPNLARPITLRTSRFNQQLTTGSLLVEIGCHGNSLQEALRGARCFARAAAQVLLPLQ